MQPSLKSLCKSVQKFLRKLLTDRQTDKQQRLHILLGGGILNKCLAVAEMGDRLTTTDMGQKLGERALPLLEGGAAGSPSNTMWPGPRPIRCTKWHLDPSSRLATTDMVEKWELCPLLGGAGSPSNTKSPGLRPICIPSGISQSIQPFGRNREMGRKLGAVSL